MSAQIGTPVQRGVSYEAMPAAPLSATYGGAAALVPVASSAAVRLVANGTETEDQAGDVDCYGTGNHHAVCAGDFKLVAGTSVPAKGDLFWDDGSVFGEKRWWVVTGDPEVKAFARTTGAPMMVNLELKHVPKWYWHVVVSGVTSPAALNGTYYLRGYDSGYPWFCKVLNGDSPTDQVSPTLTFSSAWELDGRNENGSFIAEVTGAVADPADAVNWTANDAETGTPVLVSLAKPA